MYNQLLETGAGCIAVMFASAYDLGLIPAGSLETCFQNETCTLCGSLWAARQIIEKFFVVHKNGKDPQELIDKTWSELQREVEEYKKEHRLEHNRQPGALPSASECSKLAPVVFDILLQLLRPHK